MTSVQEYYDRQWGSSGRDVFALAFKDALAHSYTLLGDMRGKKLLEIGGGSGEQAVYFASQGALVTVTDISPESVRVIRQRVEGKKVHVEALQMNAEALMFPAESFDIVYINSTLMHVDQHKVLQECARVLKKGGKLVIVEPLQYAPSVQLYRLLGSYRKTNPKYATLKMFREGKKYFSSFSHREFYLFAPLLLPVFYLKSTALQRMYPAIAKADEALLCILPFLRRACWVSVVEYRK